MKRWMHAAISVFGLAACAIVPARAQEYPSRAVTLIVPYPAGGPTDQLARVIAPRLQAKLGQNFVVENVSGGATTIATGRVARATPDGYTLLLHNLQISANVTLHKSLPFDTEKDLAPVIFINRNPLVLVGRKSLEPNTLPELIAWLRKNPGRMAHPGNGSTGHLATSLFAQEAQAKVDHIPYRGSAPAMQDIVGGHVDLFFATPQAVVQQVANKDVKGYGITLREPSPLFPGMSSIIQELGPKLEILYWHALFVPAATPKPVVDKLNAAIQEIASDAAIVKQWAETGVTPYPPDERSPDAARKIMRSEIERWGQVVRDNNIQPPNE